MASIVSTGQITLIDLNDAKALSAHISTTAMNVQIYDPNTGSYAPNWSTSNVELIPDLRITGTATNIVANTNYVKWYENGVQITSGSGGYTIGSSTATNPFSLIIAQNKLSDGTPQIKYSVEMSWTDPNFPDVPSVVTADIMFSRVKNGAAGSNTITGFLSNDTQLIPTDSSGGNGNYSAAVTTMMVYNGSTDDSANWTFSAVVSKTSTTDNVTGSFGTGASANTYTVTNMTADSGYVDITASRSGYTSITKRFSLTKAKAGTDSKSYWLVLDGSVLAKTSAGGYSPATIKVTPMAQTGSGTPTATNLRLVVEESVDGGSTWRTAVYNSDTSATYTYTPTAQSTALINMVRVSLYAAGGTTTLLDQQKIPVISDNVTAVLTNESVVLGASSGGTVSSYTNANTTMKVYVGGVDDSANWTFSATNSPNSANYTAALGTGATANVLTVTGLVAAQDSAYTDITATKAGYPSITKRFTVAKSKQGNDSKSYWLVLDSAVVSKSSNGTYSPGTVKISPMSQTGTGTPALTNARLVVEESIDGGATWRTAVYDADTSAQYTYTPTTQSTALINLVRVSMYVAGAKTTLLDQQNIPIISDSVTAVLTNESVVLGADSSGNVSSYTNATTTMKVYVAGVDDSANWTFSASNNPNSTNYTAALGTGGNKNVLTVTGLVAAQDSATTTITATKTGYPTQTKTFSLSKSKQGTDGTAYSLVCDTKAIKMSSLGAYTPGSINITGKSQTGNNAMVNYTARFVITELGSDGTTWSANKLAASDTSTYPLAYTPTAQSTTAIKAVKVQMYKAGGTTTLLDEQTIPIVADGVNSITAAVYAPNGDTIKNNSGSLTAQCDLYDGTTKLASGVTFQWYKMDATATIANGKGDSDGGDGWLKLISTADGGGTTGYATATLTVPASAITTIGMFKCVAKYNSKSYYNVITLYDDLDPVQLFIVASEGQVYKNGTGTKTLTVTAMRNGSSMDISTGYECRWTLRKEDGTVDSTFVDSGKSYKVGNPLTVPASAVTNIANLVVELWSTT